MDIIEAESGNGREAKECISRFGRAPEHNYTYFLTVAEGDAKNFLLKTSEGYGVLLNYSESQKTATMISEALAPREKQVETVKSAIEACFGKLGAKKFVIEQDDCLKSETSAMLPGNGYRALQTRYSLYWPVFNMETWSGDTMVGEDWKKLRNLRNRFYNEHSVEVVDSKSVDPAALKEIIKSWVERRKLLSLGANREDSNLAYDERYLKMVDEKFEGMDFAKTLVVDGSPSTITAGWEIPNSDKAYYSSMGICDYKFEGIGEMANLDDLCRLKKSGYKLVDFGGSPMPLLKFKLKFRPSAVYVTHTYAIVKK